MANVIDLDALPPIRISNSKAKTYRRCPKRFEFKYIMGLTRKKKAVQLYRGGWLHELLMVHYDGHDWKQRHAELTAEFNKLFEEEREELGDLPGECNRIFRSYLMNYRTEDQDWRIVDSELDELVPLPNGDVFNFIIDLVVEEPDGGLWLVDHKTVKGFMPPDFQLLDAQLARYFWAAEKMGYKPLRGVLFNEVITKPPTVPEQLKSGELTQRKNLQCDVYTYYSTIKRLGLDPAPYQATLRRLRLQNNRWFRRTRLPRDRPLTRRQMQELMMTTRDIKVATMLNQFPRSVMKDCSWDCDFLNLCTTQLMGGDIEDIIKMQYETKTRDTDE